MADRDSVRAELKSAIGLAAEYLQGVPAAKAAHPKTEPGAAERRRAEGKLEAVIRAYFGRLEKRAKAKLNSDPPAKKSAKASYADTAFGADFFDDDEFEPALVDVLTGATQSGALQFTDMVKLEIDGDAVNKQAVTAVEKYAFDLVKGIDDTSRERLRDAISEFIQNPGTTIGDVIDMLPFDDARAQLIATTEITRAYASGQKLAGDATAEAWPDVTITKMWHTNNDSIVCPLCEPLNGQEVDREEPFVDDDGNEYDAPGDPHPGDRCWVSYRTQING